jgi:hypothetical protein
METVTREQGMRRLLQLAEILDKAKPHTGGKAQGYCQRLWAWDCNTPACALGHWAIAHKDRWEYSGTVYLKGAQTGSFGSAQLDFAITNDQARELFGTHGCGKAGTNPRQAATYIRAFVARNCPTPTPVAE